MKSSAPCPAAANAPAHCRPWSIRSALALLAGMSLAGSILPGCHMGDSVAGKNAGGLGGDQASGGQTPGTGGQGRGGNDGEGSGGQGGEGGAQGTGTGGSDQRDSGQGPDTGSASDAACSTVVEEHVAEFGAHTDTFCAPLTFSTNPPASGTHYGSWPAFKVYDAPVPWGYLLHGMEHGAVVISYNCPAGCPEDLAAAKAFVASLPNKAGCTTPSIILSPEPSLDVRFGASAWNDPKSYTLRASCFDRDAFARFYTDHVDRNYESTCGGGDWSSNHWCPPGTTSPCGSGC